MNFLSCFLSRVFLFLGVLASTTCTKGPHPRPTYFPTTYAADERARAVEIYVLCDGGFKSGSGVIIDHRHVVTARHVVDCRDGTFGALVVTDVDGTTNAMLVEGVLGGNDAALLGNIPGAETWKGSVRYGSAYTDDIVCMSTAVPKRRRDCGYVYETIGEKVYTSLIVDRGNSGSGVYNAAGELVGVVVRLTTCSNGQICGGIYVRDVYGWIPADLAPVEYM